MCGRPVLAGRGPARRLLRAGSEHLRLRGRWTGGDRGRRTAGRSERSPARPRHGGRGAARVVRTVARPVGRAARRRGVTMHRIVSATFDIDSWDEQPWDEGRGARLTRTRVTKTFRSEIEATR